MDTVLIIGAVVGGVCTVLAAVGSLIVSLRTKDQFTEDVVDKNKKLEHIRVLVNSQLDAAVNRFKESEQDLESMQTELVSTRQEVAELRDLIAKLTGDPEKITKADRDQANAEAAPKKDGGQRTEGESP